MAFSFCAPAIDLDYADLALPTLTHQDLAAGRHATAGGAVELQGPFSELHDEVVAHRSFVLQTGPSAAIPLVEALRDDESVGRSHSVSAVLAHLYARAGSTEPARRFLAEALDRTRTEHERALITLQVERASENFRS